VARSSMQSMVYSSDTNRRVTEGISTSSAALILFALGHNVLLDL